MGRPVPPHLTLPIPSPFPYPYPCPYPYPLKNAHSARELTVRRTVRPALLLASLAVVAPGSATAQTVTRPDAVARLLVERIAPQPGERVLLVGVPGQLDAMVAPLRAAIVAAGAVDLGLLTVGPGAPAPASIADPWLREASSRSGAALRTWLADVDVGVMLPGALPVHAPYAALQDVLRQGQGRTVHFHWAGAYDVVGNVLPIGDVQNVLYERVLLETDYAGLSASQRAFESAMRRGVVRVTTPAGTDIRFRIGDRPVTKQDGDASAARARQARNLIDREVELPAGAIRVAPLETTVEGTIVFPHSVWSGRAVEGLSLRFEAGRVVAVEAASGRDAVIAEMDEAGDAGRAFREFALGFNPLLVVPERDPWIPYYGYGAGVVRLSLGDNTELGGNVSGGYVRWNFFIDATVRIGDDVWVQDGRMVKE